MSNNFNLPAPADKIIAHFAEKISSIDPKIVDGLYLTGSLSMNDFYFNKSDIDFLVLCKKLPDDKIASQLKHIHKTIQKRYSKPDLSGVYISYDALKTDKPENSKVLHYHQGTLRYGKFEMALVSLSELKLNAVTIFGEKAEGLPIDIKDCYLNKFLYDNINSYWAKWIKQHSSFFNRKILLLFFPRLTEWSVLGVARQLCTLQTGKIVSKTEAGIYCMQQLPEKFHTIIKEAIEIRKNNRTYPFVKSYTIKPSYKRLTETIDCVNYIISAFNKTYHHMQTVMQL
ncbi:MAG TPA: aminoglycoside adenylyltransferase domain-containing protein [Chitinophagaceae bacterium]|nr:aminoglycoside adenylyltransferase domain-containing protein [Chitinophagaceae bacterium]